MTTETSAAAPTPVIRESSPEGGSQDPLPAYGAEEVQSHVLANTVEATDDGRIDLNLDSKIASVFARLVDIPDLPEYAEPPPVYEELPPWTLCLNIVIQVVGSRGDVQPFIAMGCELQKYGHRVRIATHGVFKSFVQSSGLEFYNIGGDPAQLMAYMVKNPGLIPNIKTLREGEIGSKRSMVADMLLGCWNSCIADDEETGAPFVANAIIANPPSFAHVHCAQALSIPLHMVFTMPWSPTRSFSHPLANVRNTTTDTKLANYLSFNLVNALTWQGLADVINSFRQDVLGLESVPLTEAPFLLETLKIPYTYCWSPGLVPKPKDWQDHINVTGFIFRSLPDYTPADDLSEFLRAGPAPVYIGFGSIVVEKPAVLLQTILDAVKMSGVRCIISKGWSSLSSDEVPPDVFMIGDCPHEWLFQQVSAVVHHGGAGTTAAGLLAGKPTVIVPFFGDQPFWGDMVASVNAGPSPIPHKLLNAEKLADAISYCLTNEVRDGAKRVSETMQRENGVQAAVQSFHRHLDADKLRCDLIPHLPAEVKFKKTQPGKKLKLKGKATRVKASVLASEILHRAGKIQQDELKPYKPQIIIIENRRWDPVTSMTSAGIGLAVDVVGTTSGFVHAPYKLHKRYKSTNSVVSVTSTSSENRRAPEVDECAETASLQSDPTDGSSTVRSSSKASTKSSGQGLRAARYAGSSALTIPRLFGKATKGFMVDVPQALTEGLRATPKLYGDDIRDHQPITDWKSGFKVAGKDCAIGISTGVVDIFVQPYKGAREDGVRGFATGIGKGALGTLSKCGSGVVGLYSHSATGIWRSIHSASHAHADKGIASARRIHDIYLAREQSGKVDEKAVLRAFEAL